MVCDNYFRVVGPQLI